MSEAYLYEFLYRGRPAGSTEAPAWHVIVGQQVALPGAAEAQFVASGALTPAQAEAAGFSLSAVLDGINAAALSGRDAAVLDADTARRERDAALAEAKTATDARDGLVARIAAITDDVASVRQERDALATRLAEMTAAAESTAEAPEADASETDTAA